jgi:hypothetical protein
VAISPSTAPHHNIKGEVFFLEFIALSYNNTKMKKTIIILIAFLIVSFACKSSIKNDSNSSTFIYEDSLVDEKLLAWHFAVNSPEGKIYADSAIAVADSMILHYSANNQKQLKYILQKMNFLILKKEYEEAISVMSRSSDKLWNFGGEYFKDIFKYRILAMKAKEANNDTEYKDALKNALSLVKKYISNNQKEYDACIAVELSNQRGKYIIVTYQYVFYHFLLYGKETTDKLIESMRIKYNLHRDVIELLRNEYFAKIEEFYII